MNSSSVNKMLVVLVVFLVIINAGLLYYYNFGNKEEEKSKDERQVEYMQSAFHLNDSEIKQYKDFRSYRDSILKPMNNELRDAKFRLNDLISYPGEIVPDSLLNPALNDVARKQSQIDSTYFYHFRRIRALIKPESYPLFDSNMTRMVIRNTGGK